RQYQPGARPHRRTGRLASAERLDCQFLAQTGDELLVGNIFACASCAHRDGRAQNLGVVRVSLEVLGTAPGQQGVDERCHLAGLHGSRSAACAAIRRARCWSTLALAMLTSMARAASLMEYL